MGNLDKISTQELASLCREESSRYQRRCGEEPGHCFELFRRAIVERDQEAWSILYSQYRPLVAGWVRGSFDQADDGVNQAWAKFWRSVDPDTFVNRFSGIGKVMAFLKLCAYSVRIDEHRRDKARATISLGEMNLPDHPPPQEENLVLEELLKYIEPRLQNEQERLVFCLSFQVGLKPREIAQNYPAQFSDVKEVMRIKERIVWRLANNSWLQTWWKGQA
jgi:DNA-directed RNA polymerase specialized sigma24 family protein